MVKSLPQFTIERFISCLVSIGQHNGKIPVNSFRILDGKGGDLRRLFTQIELIEKPGKNDKFLNWSTEGEKLFHLIEKDDSFGDYLHYILLGHIPQYKVLVDLLLNHLGDLIKKKDLLAMLKEKVATNGWNLPEPTFNGLVLLARKTSILKLNDGKYLVSEKTIDENLFDIFQKCINSIFNEEKTDVISTEKVLLLYIEKQNKKGFPFSEKLAFKHLIQTKNELGIDFEFGVGTDDIPGTHAFIKR